MKLVTIILVFLLCIVLNSSTDQNGRYVAVLHYQNKQDYGSLCTMAVVRPTFLIGSFCSDINLKQEEGSFYTHKGKILVHYTIYMDNEHKHIESITVPPKSPKYVYLQILIVELKHYEFYKMKQQKSLRYVSLDLIKRCDRFYSMTFEIDKYIKRGHILPAISLCKEKKDNLSQAVICTKGKVSILGPLFCWVENQPDTKLVGLMVSSISDMQNAWLLTQEIQTYLLWFIESKNNDIYGYSHIGHLYWNDGFVHHSCPVVHYKEDWYMGSLLECKISTSAYCKVPDDVVKAMTITVFDIIKTSPIEIQVVRFEYLNMYNERFDKSLVLIQTEKVALEEVYAKSDMVKCSEGCDTPCSINVEMYTSCYIIYSIYREGNPKYSFQVVKLEQDENKKEENMILNSSEILGLKKHGFGIVMCNKYETNKHELLGFEIQSDKNKIFYNSLAGYGKTIDDIIASNLKRKPRPVFGILTQGQNLCFVAPVDANWFVASMNSCNLTEAFKSISKSKITTKWNKWTILINEPQIKKLSVETMRFSSANQNNRLVLIKTEDTFEFHRIPLIDDYVLCKDLIVTSEQNTSFVGQFVDSKPIENCNIKLTNAALESLYICTSFNHEISVPRSILFTETIRNYHLVGVPDALFVDSNKYYMRWYSISPYKLWINDIRHNNNYQETGNTSANQENTDINESIENQYINFGRPTDYLAFMVKITVNSPRKRVCYGYLLTRNWLVTSIGCTYIIKPDSSSDTTVHSLERLTSIEILTMTMDLCLVSHISFAQFDQNSKITDTTVETFVFLKLLWPVVLKQDFYVSVETIPVLPTYNFKVGTSCSVYSHIQPELADNFNYEWQPLVWSTVSVPIVEKRKCAEFYGNYSDIPWKYAYCTMKHIRDKDVFFSDPNSVLICNKRLVSMFMSRWQDPVETIKAKQQGTHTPMGWLRLDSFEHQIQQILNEDYSHLKSVKYGNTANGRNWTFLASIQYKNHHIFSASLITPYYLLTFTDYTSEKVTKSCKDLQAVFNHVDLKEMINSTNVYDLEEAKNVPEVPHLMIIRLVGKVLDIPHLKFADSNFLSLFPNIKCEAAGWPKETITRWYHHQEYSKTHKLKYNTFLPSYNSKTNKFTVENKHGSCLADDGVPLVCKGELIGMTSWNEDCLNRKWIYLPKFHEIIAETITRSKANLARNAEPLDWERYLACITIDHFYKCTGTLIHNKWILTAGVCVKSYKPKQIQAIFGLYDLKLIHEGERHSIENYTILGTNDELAMLMLHRPVPTDAANYRFMDLPNPRIGRDCSIFDDLIHLSAGWSVGQRNEPRYIQTAEVLFVKRSICQDVFPTIQSDYICSMIPNEKSTISFLNYPGGPLVCTRPGDKYRMQMGVNIWGLADSWSSNGSVAFVLVNTYYDLIQAIILRAPIESLKPVGKHEFAENNK